MMDLRQLSRAIKKAVEDTQKVVDGLNLAVDPPRKPN